MVGLDNDHPAYSPWHTLRLIAFIYFGYQIRKTENMIFVLFTSGNNKMRAIIAAENILTTKKEGVCRR